VERLHDARRNVGWESVTPLAVCALVHCALARSNTGGVVESIINGAVRRKASVEER
jgi:hypothetical protein